MSILAMVTPSVLAASAPPGLGKDGGRMVDYGGTNPTPIPIPDSGPSSLYPSNIVISGRVGTISDLAVRISGLTHTSPDDIDIMLVSPRGTRVMLQSDAGGTGDATNVEYDLYDAAGWPAVPDDGALVNGVTYRTADYQYPPTEVMEAPAPGGLYFVSTSAFEGEDSNGTWSLYVRDDAPQNSGTIASGWTLGFTLTDNGSSTSIPSGAPTTTSGPAAPYPSTITIDPDNLMGARSTRLRVVLSGLTHTRPNDIDVMLQGPSGHRIVLMSDAGGNAPVSGVTLTFDDTAASAIPDETAIITGTYQPANWEGADDSFPPPAPSGLGFTSLSAFNNTSPVGDWSLWLVDDGSGDVGSLANWALELTTTTKGDFDRDSNVDLLWRHDVSGQNVLWYMEGAGLRSGEFTDPPALVDANWKMVGTADFNDDTRTDILWRHEVSGDNVVWFMNKNTLTGGTFTTPQALADANWKIGGTGDFNGDARPDLLWRHDTSGQNVVWFMNGTVMTGGTFTNPAELVDLNWKIVGTSYFNSDAHLDILWWHQVSGQMVVWFMNGVTMTGGEFTTPNGLADTGWRPVATGDLDRDGRVDVIWRHQISGQNVVWFMGGANGTTMTSGTFTTPSTLADGNWKIVGPR